ncbi:hypothetical protein LCGC14_2506380 [marine sediment metagenome]|uniref:Uncharacterized protein n=1 Tax=marine sediment metagenome TaxID=412755 RepID=A0A0F9B153_9ZZZZ
MNIKDDKGNFIAGAPNDVKKRELKLTKEQKVDYVNTWFLQPKENRSPKTVRALAVMLEVTTPTVYSWVTIKVKEGEHDAVEYLEHLRVLAMKSNPNPRFSELYAKMAGFMEREISDEYTITADDHFRIRRESQERLREVLGGADGDRGVFDGVEGVPVLSAEVCVDNQSEHGTEDKVDAVGIS